MVWFEVFPGVLKTKRLEKQRDRATFPGGEAPPTLRLGWEFTDLRRSRRTDSDPPRGSRNAVQPRVHAKKLGRVSDL